MRAGKIIILFGGSFDPIHTGHIRVAQHALHELKGDTLFFIPARRSPHKTDQPAPGRCRFEMIKKAIEGMEGFSVCDCELSRPEPSYTLDTVLFFRKRFGPDAVLHWLVGADQLPDLKKWYRVMDLLDECCVSVMVRAGYPTPDFSRFAGTFSQEVIRQLQQDIVHTPEIDLSSTQIRCQVAAGTVPLDALPAGIEQYIRQHKLYGYRQQV